MPRLRQLILHAPLFLPAIAVIGSILAAWSHPWCLVLPLAAVLLCAILKQWRELLLSLILAALAGGLTLSGQQDYSRKEAALRQPAGETTVEGSIVRCMTRSVWVRPDGDSIAYEILPPQGVTPRLGERWSLTGAAREPVSPGIPGSFDRESWLKRNHVVGRFVAVSARHEGEGSLWSRVLAYSESLREGVISILQQGASPDCIDTQIMVSLLLGEKRGLDPGVYEDFRTSGSLHIFAVSGLHIGIAALLCLGLLQGCAMHPVKARLTVIPLLAGYVFITGMPVSAMRALVMTGILFAATALRQRNNAVNTLSLAALVFLLVNPMQLYDAGFQLSFCIFGVITTAGMWQSRRRPAWSPDTLIPARIYSSVERFLVRRERAVRLVVVLSICCWLAAIPLTAANFGTINLYSALTNTLMTPLIPLLMLTCMLAVAFAWCPPVLLALNAGSRALAHILYLLSHGVASLPAAIVPFSLPAGHDELMVIPHTHGHAAVILGNPGLLIDAGSSEDIRFRVGPALFAEGFTPKAHLLTRPQKRLLNGASGLNALWPDALQLGTASSLALPHTLPYRDGSITIYPAPATRRYGIMDDECPVIAWQCYGVRLLFIGDASLDTVMKLPPGAASADVLIIGRHDRDPVESIEWIASSGARVVILTAPRPDAWIERLETFLHVLHCTPSGTLRVRLSDYKTASP